MGGLSCFGDPIGMVGVGMSEQQFNPDLCEERHGYLKEWCQGMEGRMKKVENRFLALMTTLCLNLLGVIVILIKLLASK